VQSNAIRDHLLEAGHEIIDPKRRRQQRIVRSNEFDRLQRRQAHSQNVFLTDVNTADAHQAGKFHRCAAKNGQQSCQRPARLARSLLRLREYLHGLLVLRRELLPLQIERRQETLE
jgi:hypothetical protein